MKSVQGKVRQSNFELLRIITMLLVVATHVNFYSLGWPTSDDMATEPSTTIAKLFFESLTICCVNVFVLISGWFGIRPSWGKFRRFIFQCFFFSFGILIAAILFNKVTIGPSLLKEIAISLTLKDYWFIPSYILLYLLSPVLNAFVDSGTKKTLGSIVLCFFIFEFIYGWVYSLNGFNSGYTTISFIGLYLLGRYLRKYPCSLTQLKPSVDFFIYFLVGVINTIACIVMLKHGHTINRFFYYTCPFVVIQSIFLLLSFSKIKFTSKTVNYIASSAIAVFLFHWNHLVRPQFTAIANQLFSNYDWGGIP